MSSPQVVDSSKIERAQDIAHASSVAEKQDGAVKDATDKHEAVIGARDGDIDMTNAVAQAGRQLARSVLETRLKSLNPQLYFQRSKNDPTKCGIYHTQTGFVLGMEWDRSPEFTVNFHGTDGTTGRAELIHQVRGWRSVIEALSRKKLIEPECTKKLFEIAQGRESANWARLQN
mgnify:CR=1 FL=1